MRLWPWYVENNIVAIVVAFTALLTVVVLTTLRTVSISRIRIFRDFVMLGLHVMSAMSVIGFIFLHAKFDPGDLWLCQMSTSFQHIGECLRRMFSLCVYYLRLKSLIGPVYPIWVRYPTLLPIILPLVFLYYVLYLDLNTDKGAFISDKEVCGDLRSTPYSLILATCANLSILEALPSIVYLMLFIVPLLKYQEDVLRSIVKKHIGIAAINIIVELFLLVVVLRD